MTYLLDTNLLLWSLFEPDRLSRKAHSLITDDANFFCFSVASIWETAIKFAKHNKTFTVEPDILRRGALALGYQEIALTSLHAIQTVTLPLLHNDRFDRILIAQAIVDQLTLATADRLLTEYDASVHYVGA